jgi:hypothetical protein
MLQLLDGCWMRLMRKRMFMNLWVHLFDHQQLTKCTYAPYEVISHTLSKLPSLSIG